MNAKSNVLKSLANKMYKMEVEDYKKGETEEKPKPLTKEVKQTKEDVKVMKDVKIDDKLKDMVKGFFHQKSSNKDAALLVGLDARKPRLRNTENTSVTVKTNRKSKKAII